MVNLDSCLQWLEVETNILIVNILGSHCGADYSSNLLQYDGMCIHTKLPTFWMSLLPPCSGPIWSRRNPWSAQTPMMDAPSSSKMLQTFYHLA
jgi:hypothetical protein